MHEVIEGYLDKVTFHNAENGFSVLKLNIADKNALVTVVGYSAAIAAGEFLKCQGQWHTDLKHGRQFKATEITVIMPSSLEGIEKYLGSGLVKGIGPGFAKKMVKKFGEAVVEVIEKRPEQLLTIKGFGVQRKDRLIESWKAQKKVKEIVLFLQNYGIGTTRAVKIYKLYGDKAIDIITENPYQLIRDIKGIGFKIADTVALNLGIAMDSEYRVQAGIQYVLQDMATQGHCAVVKVQLIDDTASLLEVAVTVVEQQIIRLKQQKKIIEESQTDQPPLIFLDKFYQAECMIAKTLCLLQQQPFLWNSQTLINHIPQIEKKLKIQLSVSQKAALKLAVSHKVTVITGGPGVGKTTVVKSILTLLQQKTDKVLLAAPTGRAAKRLSESTGMEAKTLHRLLGYDPQSYGFKHNADNPLIADVLIIDEMSMVDVLLMQQLVVAIPKSCVVLFIGDVDQLPSVGPGKVLEDLIHSKVLAVVHLTEIFRQAASSQIIVSAHQINQGKLPKLNHSIEDQSDFYFIAAETPTAIQEKLLAVVTERVPKRFKFDPVHHIQVLTPMNRGELGTCALNQCLKQQLNPGLEEINSIIAQGQKYSIGDKVMQIVNNYDKDVFNGDIGFIRDIDKEENTVCIDFEGRDVIYETNELDDIVLAYAISIHKSQGSEYPAIVIPLATQHYTLLNKNLIYTAVTRGKHLVVVIGQKRALSMAVGRSQSKARMTDLASRITKAMELQEITVPQAVVVE